MGIKITPSKRYTDMYEAVTYLGMDNLGKPTAIVEPETIGINELVDADAHTALGAVATAYTGSFTKTGDQTITMATSAIITGESPACPQDATEDSIVVFDQQYDRIYLTGYVKLTAVPLPGSAPEAQIVIIGHNIGNADDTLSDGDTINYAVHNGAAQVQPITPNAALTVTSGNRWLDGSGNPTGAPITVDACNNTAYPTISIPDNSITEIELKSDDMRRLASQYTGQRATLTVAGPISVPNGAKVHLGDVVFNPAITERVVAVGGNGGVRPLLTGYISASNGTTTCSIYARNDYSSTVSVPNGTVLKVFVY